MTKKETENTDRLYEDVREKAGCPYLSDLHDAGWHGGIRNAIESIPADAYAEAAWRSLCGYITGAPGEEYASAEAVREGILTFLKQ